VVIDEDGFLFHRGRADGAIMRGGFKLLPETIERALMLHEAVSAAGVTGVPDHRLGQVPAAAIQLKRGVAQPTIAELEAVALRRIATPKSLGESRSPRAAYSVRIGGAALNSFS
jgi:acyl-coenzyme A synthetase/AMP-(fatty) acid ligase